MLPDGHVASALNVWTMLSTVCCVAACISTVFYLRVREKYIQRQNAEYEKTLPHNRRPAPKKKKEELERTLKSLQAEVNQLKKAASKCANNDANASADSDKKQQ